MTDNSLPHCGHQEHGGAHVLTPESLPHQILHHAPGQKSVNNITKYLKLCLSYEIHSKKYTQREKENHTGAQ